jgi:hypothetical protein
MPPAMMPERDDEARPRRPQQRRAPDGSGETLARHRDRLTARQGLAMVELIELMYGPSARLRPLPPGPDICPAWCPSCPPRHKESPESAA